MLAVLQLLRHEERNNSLLRVVQVARSRDGLIRFVLACHRYNDACLTRETLLRCPDRKSETFEITSQTCSL